jgi:putative FmdB family regulatory protein
MPIFEYRCTACDSQFELLILGGGAAPACPSCGSTLLERLISMFAVSSDGTDQRSRQKLGAAQRLKSESTQKERRFYRHDHHDD